MQLPFAVRISRGMLALCSLLVLAATCSLTLISWRVDDVNRRLEEVEVTHAALREENVKLLTQRAKLSSRDHVVQQASRRLGLQLPRPDQVRRL